MRSFSSIAILILLPIVASCSFVRPEQKNFFLQKEGGSRADLVTLATDLSSKKNTKTDHQFTQWDEKSYTDSYDIITANVTVHLRNSLSDCTKAPSESDKYTLFVSVYASGNDRSRYNVDRMAEAVTKLAEKNGWNLVPMQDCPKN